MKNAIILHLYYIDLWSEFKAILDPILNEGNVDLYVTITDHTIESEIKKTTPNVFIVPNKGLDIGPFIKVLDMISDKSYNTIFKIHSKKSLHHGHPKEFGEIWRRNLVSSLLGSTKRYYDICKFIEDNPNSMAGSEEHFYTFERDAFNVLHHYQIIQNTITQLKIDIKHKLINNAYCFGSNGSFYAGTMFATSHNYLKGLFSNIDMNEFYLTLPKGYTRNSIAHAMERIFGYYVSVCGGKYAICQPI